jgi:hypothetical protein
MTYAERQVADRRKAAITEWRALGRRAEDRRRYDNVLVSFWLDRFHAARMSVVAHPRPSV